MADLDDDRHGAGSTVTLTEVRGGGRLELYGETRTPPSEARIVLFDAETSVTHRPHTIRWRDVQGGWRWAARYDRAGLTVGHPLVPSVLPGGDGRVSPMAGAPLLPEPIGRDAFTYDQTQDGVVIRLRQVLPIRMLRHCLRSTLSRLGLRRG